MGLGTVSGEGLGDGDGAVIGLGSGTGLVTGLGDGDGEGLGDATTIGDGLGEGMGEGEGLGEGIGRGVGVGSGSVGIASTHAGNQYLHDQRVLCVTAAMWRHASATTSRRQNGPKAAYTSPLNMMASQFP